MTLLARANPQEYNEQEVIIRYWWIMPKRHKNTPKHARKPPTEIFGRIDMPPIAGGLSVSAATLGWSSSQIGAGNLLGQDLQLSYKHNRPLSDRSVPCANRATSTPCMPISLHPINQGSQLRS